MDAAKRALNRILGLLPRADEGETDPALPHETAEMYATVAPDFQHIGDNELEGLVTELTRYTLTLCYDGRIYDVHLREATRMHPTGTVREGAFVRVHGVWGSGGFSASRVERIG